MTVVSLTVTGANEAREEISRIIRFSDGVSRHLTLQRRHWEALDKLHALGIWALDDPFVVVFNHVRKNLQDPAEFENALRHWCQLTIEAGMADVTAGGGWEVANQFVPLIENDEKS